MSKLINNPHDFLFLYLLNKDQGEYITTIMKIYQIFTSFKDFKHLDHFKASLYGGEDTILETAIYSTSTYFPISYSGTDENIKVIHLEQSIKNQIQDWLKKIFADKEILEEYRLIESLTRFSKKFTQQQIIKFCYYFYPKLAAKSTIVDQISRIGDDVVREQLNFLILDLPVKYSIEFLHEKLDDVLNLSILSPQNRILLNKVVQIILNNSNTNQILKAAKKELIDIINNVNDLVYKQILRKILNSLLFNPEINLDEKYQIQVLLYLLKLQPEYPNKYYLDYMNLLSKNNLKSSLNTIEID